MVYPLGKEMKVLEKAGDPGFDPLVKLLLLLLLPGPRLVKIGPVFGHRIRLVADPGNCDKNHPSRIRWLLFLHRTPGPLICQRG